MNNEGGPSPLVDDAIGPAQSSVSQPLGKLPLWDTHVLSSEVPVWGDDSPSVVTGRHSVSN